MALTPEQIQAARAKYGIPSPEETQAQQRSASLNDIWAAADKERAPIPQKPGNLLQQVANDPLKTLLVKPAIRTSQAIASGAGALMGGDFGQKLQEEANKPIDVPSPFGAPIHIESQRPINEGGVRQIASDVAKDASYLAPAGKVGGAVGKAVGGRILGAAAQGATAGAIAGGAGSLGESLANKDKNFGEVALDTASGAALGGITGGALGAAGGIIGKTYKAVNPTDQEKVATAIDAVNPNLGGKKLTQAYKQAATGEREAIKGGILSQQKLTAPQHIQDLGNRLSDVLKNKNPVDNLRALGKELNTTELKLNNALAGSDPEVVFNGDKSGLVAKLAEEQTKIPREISAIRDSKSVFNSVFDFAKQVAAESDDSLTGLRDARTAFDYQAKLEYPTAFKDGGGIDIKNPAGRAIKQARDLFNDHLYETAPNGTEIKDLIRRESDVFRAIDYIAPKAAETHGLTFVQKLMRGFTDHPFVTGAAALAALGGGAAVGTGIVKAASGDK